MFRVDSYILLCGVQFHLSGGLKTRGEKINLKRKINQEKKKEGGVMMTFLSCEMRFVTCKLFELD